MKIDLLISVECETTADSHCCILTLRNHEPASSCFMSDILSQQASVSMYFGNTSAMLVVRRKVGS